MTLGEKIRRYRLLKGLTQKQLGEEVGFKKSTADVRINQYETNKMSPKEEIRSKIIQVLDVDTSALSDINIQNYEDIMHIFFELEEKLGLDIDRKDGKICLSFDAANNDIRSLITYLNMWQNQKSAMLPAGAEISDEQEIAYRKWKSRFVKNVDEYFLAKEKEIEDYYSSMVNLASRKKPYAKITSDITVLLRKIIEAGFHLSTTFANETSDTAGPGFTFVVNELLNPPSKEAEELFAQFKSELEHFRELGANVYSEFQMPNNTLTVTYFIPVASFGVIQSQIADYLDYLNSENSENDFLRDNFETLFKDSLEKYYNNIEEEIQIYCNR